MRFLHARSWGRLENLCPRWHLWHGRTPDRSGPNDTETPMIDIVLLALGLAFFAASVGYAVVCERL
ncbi:MAG: hypothetical protein HXX10_26275 [Rhodoplanes sp.]|uniref:hypothetical protein n=1 Tax=Rhodoplanes sp. TaxID=1968906 RepID=UPI00182A7507|nr:hypothetical protein [Rhodoplanes sp.]NVO17550.1 hypothetical protein [Rhodoplanes sp.]